MVGGVSIVDLSSTPDFLTVHEVATLLRRSERTIRRYIRDGRLAAVLKGRGGLVLIPRQAVEDLLNGNR